MMQIDDKSGMLHIMEHAASFFHDYCEITKMGIDI